MLLIARSRTAPPRRSRISYALSTCATSPNACVSRHSSPSQKLGSAPEAIISSRLCWNAGTSNSKTPESLTRTSRAPGAKSASWRLQSGRAPGSKDIESYISVMTSSRRTGAVCDRMRG